MVWAWQAQVSRKRSANRRWARWRGLGSVSAKMRRWGVMSRLWASWRRLARVVSWLDHIQKTLWGTARKMFIQMSKMVGSIL